METHTTPRQIDGGPARVRDGRTLSRGTPAEPLMRVLPIKRWIPQDIHSIADYASGLVTLSGYVSACSDSARFASIGLGAAVIGRSLMTDYRLGVIKVVPIRGHEIGDYLWGAAACVLPFALGYYKKSPRTALLHVVAGATTILMSLFTDFRS